MSLRKKRRRGVAFSTKVHAFFDAWHERDKKISLEGWAPVGEFVERLVRESAEFKDFEKSGVLPPVRNRREDV